MNRNLIGQIMTSRGITDPADIIRISDIMTAMLIAALVTPAFSDADYIIALEILLKASQIRPAGFAHSNVEESAHPGDVLSAATPMPSKLRH